MCTPLSMVTVGTGVWVDDDVTVKGELLVWAICCFGVGILDTATLLLT